MNILTSPTLGSSILNCVLLDQKHIYEAYKQVLSSKTQSKCSYWGALLSVFISLYFYFAQLSFSGILYSISWRGIWYLHLFRFNFSMDVGIKWGQCGFERYCHAVCGTWNSCRETASRVYEKSKKLLCKTTIWMVLEHCGCFSISIKETLWQNMICLNTNMTAPARLCVARNVPTCTKLAEKGSLFWDKKLLCLAEAHFLKLNFFKHFLRINRKVDFLIWKKDWCRISSCWYTFTRWKTNYLVNCIVNCHFVILNKFL